MTCKKCGFNNVDDAVFCMGCGASLDNNDQMPNQQNPHQNQYAPPYQQPPQPQNQYAPQYKQPPQPQNQYAQPIQPQTIYTQIAPQNTEFSAWAWLGIHILSWIPFINIILWIVWACGGTDRMSLRNYSKGRLLLILIAVLLFVILMIVSAVLGGGFANRYLYLY